MFGRKQAEINRLKAIIAEQDELIKKLNQDVVKVEESELRLMGQIREMDQLIFQMSQRTSWTEQRPFFNDLLSGTNKRMRQESDRIATVLIPEMQKAYR